MKARLLQTLFTAQVIFCSTFILAAESNKDIRALQEQNIMSVLFQQTSAAVSYTHLTLPTICSV